MGDVPLRANYDDLVDVLYVTIGHEKPYSYEEDSEGLVWRLMDDGTVYGVTIFDFEETWLPQREILARLIAQRLRISLEMAKRSLRR